MRTLIFSVVMFGAVLGAAAQDFPRAEIFGGYSYGNFQVLSSRSSLNGWNASATVNIYHWFGLTTDLGGLYGGKGSEVIPLPAPIGPQTETISEHLNTFMFGPQFSYRTGKISAFTHMLIGESRVNEKLAVSCTACNGFLVGSVSNSVTIAETTLALGIGADYKLNRNLAWRVQADYVPISTTSNLRVSTGIVFTLGK
jgi:Outer membrane protein beta-barrel domain